MALRWFELNIHLWVFPSRPQVQGHESEKFQQLFNYKIKYLRGGTESALNHVTEEAYETRLLHLLGKKGVVRQVRRTTRTTAHT